MKFIIILFAVIIIIGCSFEQSVNIIIKPSDVGYDIYSEDDELLLEFHDKNCNDDELNLLRKIYLIFNEQSSNLILTPTKEGYNISSDNVELYLEFRNSNSNEDELELLKYIYDVSVEYRDYLTKQLEY